jgi:hypothetical protein
VTDRFANEIISALTKAPDTVQIPFGGGNGAHGNHHFDEIISSHHHVFASLAGHKR